MTKTSTIPWAIITVGPLPTKRALIKRDRPQEPQARLCILHHDTIQVRTIYFHMWINSLISSSSLFFDIICVSFKFCFVYY